MTRRSDLRCLTRRLGSSGPHEPSIGPKLTACPNPVLTGKITRDGVRNKNGRTAVPQIHGAGATAYRPLRESLQT